MLNTFLIRRARLRIESLERIVGTETPASMTWTNGHVYSTIVKHSANCPCVTGQKPHEFRMRPEDITVPTK